MPRAWYIDDSQNDPQTDLQINLPHLIDKKELHTLTGVELRQVDVDNLQNDEGFINLRKNRSYNWNDELEISRDTLPNFEAHLKKFQTEHLHDDEEIRLFLDGGGYFDVRDRNDKWIRIEMEKGDLMILPAGIYHRFTTNHAKVMRLFSGHPVWKSVERPVEHNVIF